MAGGFPSPGPRNAILAPTVGECEILAVSETEVLSAVNGWIRYQQLAEVGILASWRALETPALQ